MHAILYPQENYFDDESFPLKAYSYQQMLEGENHYHDFYELVIVLDGSGKHITRGKSYDICRGDVFVIKPFVQHTYECTNNLVIENVLFIPEKLDISGSDIREIPGYFALFAAEPMLREQHDFKSRLNLNFEQLTQIIATIEKLHSELENRKQGFRYAAKAFFMELVLLLSRFYSETTQKDSVRLLKISSMIDFIETNFHKRITLAQIAAKGNMSSRTADREFKQALKMSPIDYLLHTRISNAKIYLKSQNMTISEVAFQCGFNDSNYFSKKFKKTTGYTPGKFKKTSNI